MGLPGGSADKGSLSTCVLALALVVACSTPTVDTSGEVADAASNSDNERVGPPPLVPPAGEQPCESVVCRSKEVTVLWTQEFGGSVSVIRPTTTGSAVVGGRFANSFERFDFVEIGPDGQIVNSVRLVPSIGGLPLVAADVTQDGRLVGLFDYYTAVVRIGEGWEVLWESRLRPFADAVQPLAVAALANGNFLVAWNWDNGAYGFGVEWTVLDADGLEVGEKRDEWGWYAISLATRHTDGESVLAGSTRPTDSAGLPVAMIAGLDPSGALLWEHEVGGIGSATAVLAANDGAVLVGSSAMVRLDKHGVALGALIPLSDAGVFSRAAWLCGGDLVLAGGRADGVAIRVMSAAGALRQDVLIPVEGSSDGISALSVRPGGGILIAVGGRVLETTPVGCP